MRRLDYLKRLSLPELLEVRRVTDDLIRRAYGQSTSHRPKSIRMPPKKRHYEYSTFTTWRDRIVRQIAEEWWGIETMGKKKVQLIEEIIARQDAEVGE